MRCDQWHSISPFLTLFLVLSFHLSFFGWFLVNSFHLSSLYSWFFLKFCLKNGNIRVLLAFYQNLGFRRGRIRHSKKLGQTKTIKERNWCPVLHGDPTRNWAFSSVGCCVEEDWQSFITILIFILPWMNVVESVMTKNWRASIVSLVMGKVWVGYEWGGREDKIINDQVFWGDHWVCSWVFLVFLLHLFLLLFYIFHWVNYLWWNSTGDSWA